MLAQILSDEIAKDVTGAEAQMARTAALKADVDAREDCFVNIKSTSEQSIKQGHFTMKGNDKKATFSSIHFLACMHTYMHVNIYICT